MYNKWQYNTTQHHWKPLKRVHLWSPAVEAGTIAVIDWCLHVSSSDNLFQLLFPLSFWLRTLGWFSMKMWMHIIFHLNWKVGIGQLLEILCLVLNSSTSMMWSYFSTQAHPDFNLSLLWKKSFRTHDWSRYTSPFYQEWDKHNFNMTLLVLCCNTLVSRIYAIALLPASRSKLKNKDFMKKAWKIVLVFLPREELIRLLSLP